MKKALILLAAVCFSTVASYSQKLGHINGQKLVEHMPEYKTAYEELSAYKKQFEDALAVMQQEYQAQIAEFEKNKGNWPQALLQSRVTEIQQKEQSIMDFQESASADVSAKEQEKVDPILAKAKQAIEDVAKTNGYIYVFDAGTGTLLYLGGDDVTKLVCTKLGIPDFTNEVVAPPAPKTPEGPKK